MNKNTYSANVKCFTWPTQKTGKSSAKSLFRGNVSHCISNKFNFPLQGLITLWSDPKIHGCGKTTEFLTVSTKMNHFNGPLPFAWSSLNSANISPLSEVTLACKDTCKNFLVSAVCILAEAVNGGRKNNERMLSAPPCHGSSIIS